MSRQYIKVDRKE